MTIRRSVLDFTQQPPRPLVRFRTYAIIDEVLSTATETSQRGRFSNLDGPRYPIRVPLKYVCTNGDGTVARGAGHSVSLSSTTVVFQSVETLPPGKTVRLSLEWPVRLHDTLGLTFEVQGKTIAAPRGHTAVRIVSYDFRVRPLRRSASA